MMHAKIAVRHGGNVPNRAASLQRPSRSITALHEPVAGPASNGVRLPTSAGKRDRSWGFAGVPPFGPERANDPRDILGTPAFHLPHPVEGRPDHLDPTHQMATGNVPPIVRNVVRRAGRPLDQATRSFMEPRFGRSFGDVRVHTDTNAAASARAVDAAAYTVGPNIVFGSGHFRPQSTSGRRLLAHELAHVTQQSKHWPNVPGERHEREAHHAAGSIDHGAVTIRQRSGFGMARLSVGDLERSVWARVPESVKPYVRPFAEEAKAKIDAVVPPSIEIPPSVAAVVEHPVEAVQAAATQVKETVAKKLPTSPAAAVKAVKQKVKEKAREYIMEHAGETKGVVLEATNIVDTILWLPYAAHKVAEKAVAGNKYGEALLAANDLIGGYSATMAAAAKLGLVDPVTGAPAISQAVSTGIDDAVDKADQAVFGDMPPEQALVFTSYETGELAGAVGSQVLLAFVGVEEVQLALKAVGVIGSAKGIYDSVARDPTGWSKNPAFWASVLGAVLSVVGLRSAKAGKKLIDIVIKAGGVLNAVPAVWQLYNDYKDSQLAADEPKRDQVLKRDLGAIVKILAQVVMDAVRSAGAAHGGAAPKEGPPSAARPESSAAPRPSVAAEPVSVSEPVARPAAPPVSAPGPTTEALAAPATPAATRARQPPAPVTQVAPPEATPRAPVPVIEPPVGEPKPLAPEQAASKRIGPREKPAAETPTGAFGEKPAAAVTEPQPLPHVPGAASAAQAPGSLPANVPEASTSGASIKAQEIAGAPKGGIPGAAGAAEGPPVAGGGGGHIDDFLRTLEGGGEDVFKAEGPLVRVPVSYEGAPARVLEVGSGPKETNLGLPPERELVDVTPTDIKPRRDVEYLDATKPFPNHLEGQFDTIIINNPRRYVPNIAELGNGLRPGGRIIIQGKGEVIPGQRGTNPDFNKLLKDPPPPGFRKIVDLQLTDVPRGPSTEVPKPPQILGGPFERTEGGPVGWPNARIIFERVSVPHLEPQPPSPSSTAAAPTVEATQPRPLPTSETPLEPAGSPAPRPAATPEREPAASPYVGRKPRGFETGRAGPGRNVKPGTLEGLEPTSYGPTKTPRTRSVTREEQLEGISPAKRANPNPFMNDAIKSVSDPTHPLNNLVAPNVAGEADWHKVARVTKSGKVQKGRYEGSETHPIVQAGHKGAFAAGGEQEFMLEDADLNQSSGQTIESKGAYSFKERLFVTKSDGSGGVWVDRASLQQWERLGVVPEGTVDNALKHPSSIADRSK
jgi:hypothetical protein